VKSKTGNNNLYSATSLVARLPEPEQREIVAAGPKAVVDVARDIRLNGIAHRTNFSWNNEWYTPEKDVELVREVLGETNLDPASHAVAQEAVKVTDCRYGELRGCAFQTSAATPAPSRFGFRRPTSPGMSP
jgi:hypothetical protein